jgi:nitrogen fixation protein FixH
MTRIFTGPITGPKFFAIFSSFFVVIIAVNIVLAYQAVHTFPGLETDNSYLSSQTFDHDRTAQLALGWTVGAVVHQNELQLSITDSAGNPVQVADVTGTFGRATEARDDQTPAFVFDGTLYRAPVVTSGGNWNLRLVAHAQDGTLFRQRIVVLVD